MACVGSDLFAMATADGLFTPNEVNGDGADTISSFERLAAAVHGGARHLEAGRPRN